MNNKEINEKQIKEIRSLLEHAKQPDIDEGRKRKTLELLQAERKRLHIRSKKTYGQRVWEQIPYISPAAWLLQGILLLMIGWGFYAEGREEILLYLLFCAPMAGVVGFTEIMRSYRQNMWELEQACRKCLRLRVSDTVALARVLSERNLEYTIVSDTEADLYDAPEVTGLVQALARENCVVQAMQERDESLEGYYVNLIGGGRHV